MSRKEDATIKAFGRGCFVIAIAYIAMVCFIIGYLWSIYNLASADKLTFNVFVVTTISSGGKAFICWLFVKLAGFFVKTLAEKSDI